MDKLEEVYVSFSPALFRTLLSNVERGMSAMISEEKIKELENISFLIQELVCKFELTNLSYKQMEKERQYYMTEYRQITEKYHKLRRLILESECQSCTKLLD